ncbi:MAG TPA: extracellular solute-binding protein, partial [Candidatus Hydrogenedentes bacterium]|nr:extracellular solute-binding protein [Candidatus Hydrogenedentota bacterium]
KVIVQCLAGKGPDLLDCYDSGQLMAYVRSDIAMDVTDELAERGVDMSEIWPCAAPLYAYQGRVYGHPGNANAVAILYNERLFDEAGLPYPAGEWTWDEFIDVAQKLTTYDERGRPTQFGFIGPWDGTLYQSVIKQWGGSMYTPEGTRCVLDSSETIAAMEFMRDLIYEHKVMPTPGQEASMATAGGWSPGVLSLYGAEKGAMAVAGRWWLMLFRKEDYAHLRLGAAPLPRGPSDMITGGGRATLVNKHGKHIEGALEFLEFLHSEEFNEIINRWADALPPVRKYAYVDGFLHNREYPEEDFHEVWRIAGEKAIPWDISPYVNGTTANIIMLKQTDLVRFGQKSAADAMQTAARLINEAIVEQLKLDRPLRKQYYAAIEQGALSAWDNEAEAP